MSFYVIPCLVIEVRIPLWVITSQRVLECLIVHIDTITVEY